MVLPRADRVRTRSPRRRVALTCDAASRAACLIGYLPDSQSFIYQTRILGAASRRLSITPNASRKTYSLSPPKCHVRHTSCTGWGYDLGRVCLAAPGGADAPRRRKGRGLPAARWFGLRVGRQERLRRRYAIRSAHA